MNINFRVLQLLKATPVHQVKRKETFDVWKLSNFFPGISCWNRRIVPNKYINTWNTYNFVENNERRRRNIRKLGRKSGWDYKKKFPVLLERSVIRIIKDRIFCDFFVAELLWPGPLSGAPILIVYPCESIMAMTSLDPTTTGDRRPSHHASKCLNTRAFTYWWEMKTFPPL